MVLSILFFFSSNKYFIDSLQYVNHFFFIDLRPFLNYSFMYLLLTQFLLLLLFSKCLSVSHLAFYLSYVFFNVGTYNYIIFLSTTFMTSQRIWHIVFSGFIKLQNSFIFLQQLMHQSIVCFSIFMSLCVFCSFC